MGKVTSLVLSSFLRLVLQQDHFFFSELFLSNIHLILFQALSNLPLRGRAGVVFSYFLFKSFRFKVFPVPSVYGKSK